MQFYANKSNKLIIPSILFPYKNNTARIPNKLPNSYKSSIPDSFRPPKKRLF